MMLPLKRQSRWLHFRAISLLLASAVVEQRLCGIFSTSPTGLRFPAKIIFWVIWSARRACARNSANLAIYQTIRMYTSWWIIYTLVDQNAFHGSVGPARIGAGSPGGWTVRS